VGMWKGEDYYYEGNRKVLPVALDPRMLIN
jgi:hypothetical protein